MPHVNLWVRKDDMAAWNAIEDKPTWLHKHLNGSNSAPEPAKNRITPMPKRHKEIIADAASMLEKPKKTLKSDVTYKKVTNWGA